MLTVIAQFCILAVVVDKQTMTKLYRAKHKHIYNETGYLNKIMGYINVNPWVMYCSFARCYYWGKLGKGYVEFLSIISQNFIWIYNYSNKNLL